MKITLHYGGQAALFRCPPLVPSAVQAAANESCGSSRPLHNPRDPQSAGAAVCKECLIPETCEAHFHLSHLLTSDPWLETQDTAHGAHRRRPRDQLPMPPRLQTSQ